MNVTFLLGNGFDIGIGLKTKYTDFYPEYCRNNLGDKQNIVEFKTLLMNDSLGDNKDEEKIIDWSDFEKAFGQHSTDFSLNDKSLYIDRFEDFVMKFNSYLEEQERNVDYSDTEQIAQVMQRAVTTFHHIRLADRNALQRRIDQFDKSRRYRFISFNYTRTVDKCVNVLKENLRTNREASVGAIHHIHGYIDQAMIMGVNDASQISNPEFATDEDVVNEIVKPMQNQNARTDYERGVIATIKDSDFICVYGMSIGETDAKWWKQIAQWLSVNTGHMLVILKYEKDYNERFPFSQRRFTEPLLQSFLSYSDLSDKVKKQISSQIYIGINHNIFAMNLCKEKNISKQENITLNKPVIEG